MRWRKKATMGTILASCYDCGDVELQTGDITVLIDTSQKDGSYRFTCPSCRKIVMKNAPGRIVTLLVTSGVRPIEVSSPVLELPTDDPPLGDDDLIDLGLGLLDDGKLAEELQRLAKGK